MSNVSTTTICSQCGNHEADKEFDYKSGEWSLYCSICGYSSSHMYKTDENHNYIMQTDIYVIDGKTVGYSKLKDMGEYPDLSDFVPFSENITQNELQNFEEKNYIVKLDSKAKYGIRYLTFWFDRKIVKKGGITYLHHTHPIVEDSEEKGRGVICICSNSGSPCYFEYKAGAVKTMKKIMKSRNNRKYSYITSVKEDGSVIVLWGAVNINGRKYRVNKA